MAKTASRKAPASPKKAVAAPKKSAKTSAKTSTETSTAAAKKSPSSVKAPVPVPVVVFPAAVFPAAPAPDTELKALPEGEPLEGHAFPFEIDPKRIEEGLSKLRGELVHWANKGRYTKVRFKFRGKQLLPDLP